MDFTDDIHAGERNGYLNITSRSRGPRARLLSALANRPFQFEYDWRASASRHWYSSLEGWYQGIKFSPDDPRRYEAFASCFGHAKAFSKQAENQYVWWGGFAPIVYASPPHKQLIEAAFRASFPKGSDREKALLDTRGLKLVHETNEPDAPDSPLTKVEFAALLTKIRIERSVAQRVTR
jgi:hypothetical protein